MNVDGMKGEITMCTLTHNSDKFSILGYKVAIKRDNKYFSAAMGFEYEYDKLIPEVKTQHRLCQHFNEGILDPLSNSYNPAMVGRTAVFKKFEDAVHLYADIKRGWTAPTHGKPVILLSSVHEDLMEGHYGENEPVAAGRRIRFSYEIEAERI